MLTIGIDPGKTTGVVLVDPGAAVFTEIDVDNWLHVVHALEHALADEPECVVHVAMEQYRIGGSTHKKTRGAWSFKTMGAVELWAHDRGFLYVERPPSTTKTTVTDEVLRRGGFWTGRSAHVRDAYRSAFHHLVEWKHPWAARRLMLGGE
jgi:hypothetical protein